MSELHIQIRDEIHNQFIKEDRCGKLSGLTLIELNVTELCNRKCIFCPRSNPKVYPNKKLFMNRSVIERIIEQLKLNNFTGAIHISGFGEPLLNPQVLEYIILLKTELNDCYIELTTNGDFLTTDIMYKIQDYVDRVVVDCYDGEHQVLQNENLFKKISFTKYFLRRLWYDAKNQNIDTLVKEWNFNNRAGAVTNIKFDRIQQQCYMPFYRITIDWNGNIVLCCNDWLRQESELGNILTTPLHDLWFSEKLKEIRQNLANGLRINNACKNCSVNGTLYGKASFDIFNQHQN